VYVIRTNLPKRQMSAANTVRNYTALNGVERAFRSLKTVDLKIRPIYHFTDKRVRAHIFLCMLASYVEWHMREAWRELLFADEDLQARQERDPVAPARRSKKALEKIHARTLPDGSPVHSFYCTLRYFEVSRLFGRDSSRVFATEHSYAAPRVAVGMIGYWLAPFLIHCADIDGVKTIVDVTCSFSHGPYDPEV
jgi:hypothetical protein